MTFKDYLDVYVPYLLGEKTSHVPRMVSLLVDNPRAVEPFLLWALYHNDYAYTRRSIESDSSYYDKWGRDLIKEFALLHSLYAIGILEECLEKNLDMESPYYGYSKCWFSFKIRRDYPENFAERD